MRWLKSTTNKEWVFGALDKQFIVPGVSTPKWLIMEENEFSEIMKQPVVSSLVKGGAITVVDKEPEELKNTLPNLQVTNTALKAELETVKAERDVLKARNEELEKGTTGVNLEAEIEKAVSAVKAEYEQKLKELDDKASGIIADKDAEIEKLNKKLKKADKE